MHECLLPRPHVARQAGPASPDEDSCSAPGGSWKPVCRRKSELDQWGEAPRLRLPTTDSSISGSPLTANRRFRSSVTVWKDCGQRWVGGGRQRWGGYGGVRRDGRCCHGSLAQGERASGGAKNWGRQRIRARSLWAGSRKLAAGSWQTACVPPAPHSDAADCSCSDAPRGPHLCQVPNLHQLDVRVRDVGAL